MYTEDTLKFTQYILSMYYNNLGVKNTRLKCVLKLKCTNHSRVTCRYK